MPPGIGNSAATLRESRAHHDKTCDSLPAAALPLQYGSPNELVTVQAFAGIALMNQPPSRLSEFLWDRRFQLPARAARSVHHRESSAADRTICRRFQRPAYIPATARSSACTMQ